MRDKELLALVERKAKAGIAAAAVTHAELWIEEMSRKGPSVVGEYPAKVTGRAIDSVSVATSELKAASGSNQSIDYLTFLEENLGRKGVNDIVRDHRKIIADAARAALENQK